MTKQKKLLRISIKRIIFTGILGALLLVGVILGYTTRATLLELWKTRFMAGIVWYMVYVDAFFFAVGGAFIPSLISLKFDIRVEKKVRWLLLTIGVVAMLLYLYLGAWMTFTGFSLPGFLMPLVRNPTLKFLIF